MTVLLWGLPSDSTTASVLDAVSRLPVPHLFLDQRDVLGTTVTTGTGGVLRTGATSVALDEISAAYLRPYDGTRVAAVRGAAPGSSRWTHTRQVEETLAAWSDVTPALVISRPAKAAGNGSKPAQLRDIAASGFAVPRTLVTNDPAAAERFRAAEGPLIYKSASAVRSRVRRLDTAADLTVRVAGLTACPAQFQHRVPGTDVRVHVAGAEVFATRILSEADDYRYATRQGLPPAELEPMRLPVEIAERCRGLAHRLGLPVAGVDLRVTPSGAWYCFEVNPSPAFSYYEAGTGQPIAAAVAGLLAAAETCARATR